MLLLFMLVFNVQLCWTFRRVSVMFNFVVTIMQKSVACV